MNQTQNSKISLRKIIFGGEKSPQKHVLPHKIGDLVPVVPTMHGQRRELQGLLALVSQ